MKIKLFIVLLFAPLMVLLLENSAFSETTYVQSNDIYSTIDTKISIDAMNILQKGSLKEKNALIKTITSNPGNYCPTTFINLSQTLWKMDKKDEADFWYQAAMLRTYYDKYRCTDKSVSDTPELLRMYIPFELRLYEYEDLARWKNTIKMVVKWDDATPYNYDQRWINLHGMGAFTSSSDEVKPLSIPKEEWPQLAEKTRKWFLAESLKYIDELTPAEVKKSKDYYKRLINEQKKNKLK
ncbi:MAG: hypothetical protein WC890_05055 [Candidatus Margulisiibacteriota bacterium]